MKRVFVTGGRRGIGKAVVNRFEEAGYEVTAPAREELDLNNPESIRQYLTDHAGEKYDVIINNAGCNDIHEIEEITDDEIETMVNVNLIAPLKLIRGMVGPMKSQHYGRIINIGSIWASVSKAGRCVYSATKNGIHGITNTLAVELAEYNILVNTVCPGFTMTELTKKNNTPEQIREISKDIPIGRMAEPEEMAEIIYFLASEKNTYLTGQKILVDGGFAEK